MIPYRTFAQAARLSAAMGAVAAARPLVHATMRTPRFDSNSMERPHLRHLAIRRFYSSQEGSSLLLIPSPSSPPFR